MGHIFSFHKQEGVGYTPFPREMQESVSTTTHSPIFRSWPLFVFQCIYNWYRSDDTELMVVNDQPPIMFSWLWHQERSCDPLWLPFCIS